ncbi:VIER F-box protein 2, partial [Tanacetum coccineum]
NDINTRQFGNQRTVAVAGNWKTVGNQVVQQSGIQCINCKGFGNFAKECRKPKRVKDYEYHKEKIMLCKQESKAKIQEVLHATNENSGPTSDAEPLEKKDKEAAELKCKEALDLQAHNTHKNAESLKTEAYRKLLVKEENAKLVNQISMQERQNSKIANEKEELKKDFKEWEDKDIDKQIALENQVKILRVIHNTSFSRPQLKSIQMKDKVMPNNSQVMIKKKKVEDHHRISSFSNKTKSITACNDSLNAKTLNAKNGIVKCLTKLKYVKDQLCSSCEMSKAKRSTFKTKTVPSLKGRLHFLHMEFYGPMWVESINGKKYILVIKGEFEKLESIKISNVSLTCKTSLEIFNEEFIRMSRMEDDLFTYEVEIAEVANIPCDLKKEDDSKQHMSHKSDDDMEYDPFDVEFTEWLASKNFNYKIMDHYTMKALWIYWARGDDEVELTDEESFDSDDEDEVSKIFRIETNVFDFETPLCKAFKEFNYLLQINPDVLKKDIDRFKTYEEYKDDWIYEWNKDVPWVHERPWTENEPTCSWKDDGYCNGGNLSGAYIIGNTLRYQDLEWYDALKDNKLKEKTLKNKAIMEGMIDKDEESSNEGWRRWDDFDNINRDNKSENEMEHEEFDDHERPACYIRRFEMVKYSFRDDEEYAAIKENEYDYLMNASKEAIHTYQEIFRMMDEGWMDLAAKKSMKLVKYQSSGILLIMEYLVNISKKARILELKRRYLKITVLTPNTPYPSRKIRRIYACTLQKTTKETRSIRCIPGRPIRRIQAMEIWKISNVVEFFEGWKPLSPLQLAVEEVMSE